MPKNTVIIAAGGVGKRTGLDIPKQFAPVLSKPIIAYTIEVFENIPSVDEIIISCHADYIDFLKRIISDYGFLKVTDIISGGDTRQESVYKAVQNVSRDTDYILIHDAARPLINRDSIERCLHDAYINGCAAVGVRVTDTLKKTDDNSMITDTVDRSNLWQIQTPQIFRRDIIASCHKLGSEDGVSATDDCMLCERYGYAVKVTEASCINIKITKKEDILLTEAIING